MNADSKPKNIKLTITDATTEDKIQILKEANEFGYTRNVLRPPLFEHTERETFIARNNGALVGFGQVHIFGEDQSLANVELVIVKNKFRDQRVARTILGKIHAKIIKTGVKRVIMRQDLTALPRKGNKFGYWELKTPYKVINEGEPYLEWFPVASRRQRKPKQKPAIGLARQNIMSLEKHLLRRGKR